MRAASQSRWGACALQREAKHRKGSSGGWMTFIDHGFSWVLLPLPWQALEKAIFTNKGSDNRKHIFNHHQHSPLTSYRVQLKCSDSVCKWKSLSRVRLFMTPWTIQSMEFSRPEYWSGSLSLLQEIFPTQGSNSGLPHLWSRGISQGGQHWGQGKKAWTRDGSAWVPSEWDGCTIYPFSFPFPPGPPHFLSIR